MIYLQINSSPYKQFTLILQNTSLVFYVRVVDFMRSKQRRKSREVFIVSQMTLHNVCKIYQGKDYAVSDFNLEIKDKEFVIFVGPSGCGKSTVLRMIAGLEEITDGELWIDGNLMNYTEPKDRNVSMVFQNYALYPNMNVYDNIAFSLAIRKVPKKEIKKKVQETAKMLEIEQLLDRRPAALSGGQRQRVAIGSAILREPGAFLMDEPLSNLDAKLRTQMRTQIAKLHKELGATIIYVTHDQTEAMTLGTKIVVLKEGVIQQVDTPQNLYDHPNSKFVAGFIGSPSMNFVKVQISLHGKEIRLFTEEAAIPMKERQADFLKKNGYWGAIVILGIRSEDLYLMSEIDRMQEEEKGKKAYSEGFIIEVDSVELLGAEKLVYFYLEGGKCVMRVASKYDFNRGDKIEICMDLDKIQLFDQETEENIWRKEAEEYEV